MSDFTAKFMKLHPEITFEPSKTNLSRNYDWKNVIPFRFWDKFDPHSYITHLETVIDKILIENNVNLSSKLEHTDYKYYEQIIIEKIMYPKYRTEVKRILINSDEKIRVKIQKAELKQVEGEGEREGESLVDIAKNQAARTLKTQTSNLCNDYVNSIIHFIREESNYGNNITYYLPFLMSDKLEFKDYDKQYNYLRYILTHLQLIKKTIPDENRFKSDYLYDYSKVFRELRHYLDENGKLNFTERKTIQFIKDRCLKFTAEQIEFTETEDKLEDTIEPLSKETLLKQYSSLAVFCSNTLKLNPENQLCKYINVLITWCFMNIETPTK